MKHQYPILHIVRDIYGQVTLADWDRSRLQESISTARFPGATGNPIKHRVIKSTRDLAVALLQSGSSKDLVSAAWRMAVHAGAVDPSHRFTYGDPLDLQTIEYARRESDQLDFYISQLVNNPRSRFYLHG